MPKIYLTQRASRDLDEIEAYSTQQWGRAKTKQYIAEIYRTFDKIAEEPRIGRLRAYRASPFLMAPAKRHFVIYKPLGQGIAIATVLHGRRNIEAIVRDMGPSLMDEITQMNPA